MNQLFNTQVHSSLLYHSHTLNPALAASAKTRDIGRLSSQEICFRHPVFLLLRRVKRCSWRTSTAHVEKHTRFQANCLRILLACDFCNSGIGLTSCLDLFVFEALQDKFGKMCGRIIKYVERCGFCRMNMRKFSTRATNFTLYYHANQLLVLLNGSFSYSSSSFLNHLSHLGHLP